MSTCAEQPRYELVSTKKVLPEEEKYHDYLLETLNKKPKMNFVGDIPYKPSHPETSKVFYGQTVSNYPNAGYNSTVNYYNFSNAFTGFTRLPKQTELEFGMPIEDENNVDTPTVNLEKFKTEETFGLNTLQAFDKNLEELKKENSQFKKFKGKNKNPSKNYISQEEIKQQKEIIFGSINDLQKYLQNRKNKGENCFKRFIKLSEEKGIHLCDLMEAKTPEELEKLIKEIIKKEEASEKKRERQMERYNLKNLKKMGVIRKGYTTGRPLDGRDIRFIKKYARYLLFKKIKDAQIGFTDDDNERIYSQRIFNKDNDKDAKSNISSFVAFAKLVFALLDKDQNGFISKDYLVNNVTLDDKILQDLGFENQNNFKQILLKSNKNNNISEKDFINILLSQAGILEEYQAMNMNNLNNLNVSNSYETKRKRRSQYGDDIVKISDDEDSDFDLPGLRTHVYDFLELPDNYQKLEALKKLEEENLYESKDNINKNQIKKKRNIILDLSKNRQIAISYHEYLTFLRRFHRKDQINFTIPEPFEFLKKNYQKKKIQKIKEILEDRVRDEDYYVYYQFHANELKKGIWGNQMQNIIEYEKEQRQQRTEKLKEKIIAEMKPFSFYEKDERKYKEKIKQESIPPTFPPFRANAIKWLSQVLIYEDMLKQEAEEREQRIKERMEKTQKASKLPPRMALYEEERIQKEKQKKIDLQKQYLEEQEKRKFKANKVPEFTKLQTEFEEKLKQMKEERKKQRKALKPIPFTFHEPKKKVAELCQYLDQENDHFAKNPKNSNKNEIEEIIKKMQRKPKIEPKSTHSLDLLMELRRKELEDKENQQKLKELEDNMRAERQERLKERVLSSKAIVDHTNQLEEMKQKRQEEFREELQRQEESYRAELARRLERVYNRPLLVEQVGNKGEKFSLNRNNLEDLDELQMQFGPIAEEDEYEQQQVIGEDEGDDAEGEEEVGEEGEKIEEEVDGEKEENGEDEDKK